MTANPPTPASVEAVARAICRKMRGTEHNWDDYGKEARAAILAYQAQGEGGLETAKRIVLAEREAFLDPSYAGGPVGAFGELFACDQILKALDQAALAQPATAAGQGGDVEAQARELLATECGIPVTSRDDLALEDKDQVFTETAVRAIVKALRLREARPSWLASTRTMGVSTMTNPPTPASVVEALKPFATVGQLIDGPFGPALFADDDQAFKSGCAWTENGEKRMLTWGDFRRARAALQDTSLTSPNDSASLYAIARAVAEYDWVGEPVPDVWAELEPCDQEYYLAHARIARGMPAEKAVML